MADYAPDESWGEPEEVTGSIAPPPKSEYSDADVKDWGTPSEQPQGYSQQDVQGWGTPEEVHASELGSAVRRGIMEIPAGLAGGAAGVVTGAAAGTLALPTAPFTAGIGPVAAGLAAGVPAAMGASYLVHKGQDWVLDALGLSDGTGFMSKAQEVADRMENPKSTFTGELAGGILPSFGAGIGGGVNAGARALGAGLQGGMEVGQELYRGEELDPYKIGVSTAAGAVFAKPRPWLDAITPHGGGSAPSEPRAPGGGPQEPGGPGNGRPGSPEQPLSGEVIPPEQRALGYENNGRWAKDIESATEQRNAFDQTDPMWKFWDDYLRDLQSREDNKGWADVDASLGPRSNEHPFTYETGNRANDVTTVAAGVAADNPRAPQIDGAGNPIGAPMQARAAQRPTGLLRDYRKTAPETRGEIVTQESTRVSEAPIHEDVAAALKGEQHEVSSPEEVMGRNAVDTAAQVQENQGIARHEPQLPAPAPPPPQAAARPAQPAMSPRPRAPGKTPVVTETVTPHEQRVLDAAKKALTEANMPQVLERLNAMPPKQAAVAATKLLTAIQSKTGEATAAGSAGEVRLPGKRPELASGVTARSKADLARKEGVIKAYDAAVSKYGTAPEGETQGGLLSRLSNLVKHADELSGGNKYRPNVKPPSWQLVQAARKVLAKPTPAGVKAFRQTEATLKGEGPADEGARLNQETARIEGDIEHRPQLSEAASEALVQQHTPEQGRPDHETFTNEAGDESAVYTGQHNQLTNWLNSLSETSHAALMREHPDLALDVKTTQDPAELKMNLMDDLARLQEKAGTFDAVPAETAPVTKRQPIKSRDDLAPTEPGKPASAGRVVDKDSPEFKKLAAQYAGGTAKKGPKYDLEHEEAAQRTGAEDAQRRIAEAEAVDGSEPSAMDHFRRMMSDESGAVPMDKFFRDIYNWMKKPPTATRVYADDLGYMFTRMSNRITQFNGELRANARAAPVLVPANNSRLYRAMETGEVGLLPAKLQEYHRDFIKPLETQYGKRYDEYRDLAIKHQIEGYDTLPERKNNGNGFMDWTARIQKGKQKWDHADEVDPYVGKGRSLDTAADTAELRGYFALQNAAGARMTIIPGDGHFTIMRNGAPTKVTYTSNTFDPHEVGATIKMKTKGKEDTWTVDHSTIDEIKLAMGKNPNGTWKVEYHDVPIVTMSNALYGLNSALERLKLYDEVVTSDTFKNNVKYGLTKAEAAEQNLTQTNLPQFGKVWMPKRWAWVMDDFRKQGLGSVLQDGSSVSWLHDKVSAVSSALYKSIVVWAPLVQGMNELDKAVIGRGYNWVTPAGLKSLAVNGQKSLKSVWTQDHIQKEFIEAGGNPMYMHTVTHDLMPQLARRAGMEIERNLPKWDPFAKAFKISTADLLRTAYDKSNLPVWWLNDVLSTFRYLEEKQLRNLTPREAAQSTHDFVDSYTTSPTIGSDSNLARATKQILSDPTISMFYSYHAGLLHSWATIFKNLLGPNATKQDRVRAAGQGAVAFILLTAAYPMLSAAYAKLTGEPTARFDPRGMSRVGDIIKDVAKGDKPVQDVGRNVLWTPSVPFDSGTRLWNNQDWRGKSIIDMQGFDPKNAARAAGQLAEFGVGQTLPPYKTISQAMAQPGADAGSVTKKLMEELIVGGFKTPSDAATRREMQLDKIRQRELKARNKRPGGLIERGVNSLLE